jgi:DNA-directed RNA polymerase subunit RPC12/RpoP
MTNTHLFEQTKTISATNDDTESVSLCEARGRGNGDRSEIDTRHLRRSGLTFLGFDLDRFRNARYSLEVLTFKCGVCRELIQTADELAGQVVRCPGCQAMLRAPAAPEAAEAATPSTLPRIAQEPPRPAGGRRYGFNCQYCSSRLEAVESNAGNEGVCPTCGSAIIIPILDRFGRLIDPMTGKVIKQDPHPVHAYAAAGERAPLIIRKPDRSQAIQCPRCRTFSAIVANNCKSCGMPFTMEGTTIEASGQSNGFAVASLVLGVIGIPMFCSVIIPLLAIVFGAIALLQTRDTGTGTGAGRGLATAGAVCGGVGLLIAAVTWLR